MRQISLSKKAICLCGNSLGGGVITANPMPNYGWVKIYNFHCAIHEEIKSELHRQLTVHFDLRSKKEHGSLSGPRGILEPFVGYDGPKLRNEKKPKKAGTHESIFTIKGQPALCYEDRGAQREPALKLSEIKLAKLGKPS